MNALELQGLTKHYKDFTLGPLNLTLPGGTICGLIGENGAGKSTTIRLILDMVQRDGGYHGRCDWKGDVNKNKGVQRHIAYLHSFTCDL